MLRNGRTRRSLNLRIGWTLFARASVLSDNPRGEAAMSAPANLFRLLNEFIVLLLGALLILIAATHTMGVPSRPSVLMILGVVFIFWAARSWARPAPKGARMLTSVRAGS